MLGSEFKAIYETTNVEYTAVGVLTGTDYPWASADGSVAGILPLTPWDDSKAGYFSYNPGSALLNYLLAVNTAGGMNSNTKIKFEVTYTVPTASVIGRSNIVCRYATPFISRSVNSNAFSLPILMTEGANTIFKGFDETVFNSIANLAFCTDPERYKFRLTTSEPQVSGSITVDITITGNVV